MAEINKERLRELFYQLVNIYSPSGKEEECLEFLSDYLKQQGFLVTQQPVDEHRYNLLVLPEGKDVEVVFLGHVDTVSAYDLDNYQVRQEDDIIFGLGAADMKGGCAAMIEAFVANHNSANPIPAALALVVGEEEEGDGTKCLLKDFSCKWAIVAEPTDLIPCISHYGYIEVELKTLGHRRHPSLASREHDAIHSMLGILLKLSSYLDKERSDIIYNIRDVHSSEAGFAVADRCIASLDVHLSPSFSMEEMTKELKDMLKTILPEEVGSFTFSTVDAGYQLEEKGELLDILKNVYANQDIPWKLDSFRSHSDANLLKAANIDPVILGPGKLSKAHTPNESVSFKQVVSAANIYSRLLKHLER